MRCTARRMKLISWNVNGIRAVLKKGFSDFIEGEEPDIISYGADGQAGGEGMAADIVSWKN